MFELPIPEDIYDFDSFNLRDIIENIQNGLAEIDDETEKPKEIASWIKKAKKIHGMIALELEERKAVEDFEEFCQKGEDYLKGLDKNPYSKQQNHNEIPKQKYSPQKARDPSPQKSPIKRSPAKLEHSQISTASNTSGSKGYSQTTAEIDHESASNFDTESRKSMTLSEESGSRIYGRMHHANKKKQSKKNALFEFMKQTLEASRITDEKMKIGKSSVADIPIKSHGPAQEEEKSSGLHRKSKPSQSEAAQRNANKAHPVPRSIGRPNPGFSTSETRTGTGMALGGFPSIANTTSTSVFSDGKKSNKTSKKKKDPSLTDLAAPADEPKTKPRVPKATKTVDENKIVNNNNNTTTATAKPKKEKTPVAVEENTTAGGKNKTSQPKATTTQNTAATKPPIDQKTKPQTQVQAGTKPVKENQKKDAEVVVVKDAKEKGKEENKENKTDKTDKIEKWDVVASSQSSLSSSKYESDNKIDEEAEESEHDEEEKKIEVIEKKEKQIENITDNESQKVTNNEKSTEVSSLTHLQESDLQSNSQKITDQSSRGTTPGMQVSRNNDRLESEPESEQPSVTVTARGSLVEGQVKENKEVGSNSSLKDVEEEKSTPKAEVIENKVKKEKKPKSQEFQSWPSYANIDPESDDSDDEEEETGKTATQEKQETQTNEEEEVKTMPKVRQYSIKSIPTQEKAETKEVVSPTSPTKSSKANNYQKTSSLDNQSSLLLEYSKPGYYSSDKKPGHVFSNTQPEIMNQEQETDLRAAFLNSQSPQYTKERTPSISSTQSKPGSLPKIDTSKTSKDKKGVQSPTKSKEKTKLPSIDGGKLSLAGESVGQEVVRHENPRAKKLSEASSPNQTRKPSGMGSPLGPNTAATNKTPQKDQENNNVSAPGQKRSVTGEGKKADNQLRTRTQNTTKPAGKLSNFPPVADEDIVDYSNFVQSFQQLFSSAWMSPNSFDYLGIMREIHTMFTLHINYVDGMDNMLAKYKPSIAPLELGPNDLISQNNMNHLFMYATKTNIDLNVYLQRQQVFQKNVSLLKYGEDPDDREPQPEAKDLLHYRVVKTKSEVYDIITRSFLRKQNWVELPHGVNLRTTWNLMWTWSKPQIDMNKLLIFQKVNHFPGNKGLVRKDLIKSNFERTMKLGRKAAEAFNILPETYTLPKDISKFIEVFYEAHEREGPLNIWIMKPVGKSRGRGISLINDIGGLKYAETMVAQKYLKNPLLLNGFKFDMRIYVLVTSLNPIEAFVYKEGFARLSTVPFNLNVADLDNLFIHLTNSSVQKNSNNVDNMSSDAIVGGTKISLKTLRQRLERKGISWAPIWTQVHEIIAKSLLACQNDVAHHPNAFELFGYDVIIDSNLKCWLLEINSSPSLERMNILDDLVKQQLIDDTIDLVAPLQFDRTRLLQVLERRIGEEQRLKSTINTMNNSQAQLNKDLTYILHGRKMRDVSELPEKLGNYERVAPTEMSERIAKLIQSYKVPFKNPMDKDNKK